MGFGAFAEVELRTGDACAQRLGLPLDGLAGPLTLMQLNRASGVEEPRLRPEP